MTQLEQLLNKVNQWSKALDKATRKPRKFNREKIIKTVGVATTIISAASLVFPQIRGLAVAANVVNKLQETVLESKTDDTVRVRDTERSEERESEHRTIRLVPTESE